MSNSLEPNIEEFLEYVGRYFNGTKPPKPAWEFFDHEQAQLQTQLLADATVLNSYLDDFPHYVAVAFVGKVKVNANDVTKRLLDDYTKITADQLREARSLKVDASVRPLLDAIHPTGKLPKIVALYCLAERRLKVPAHP